MIGRDIAAQYPPKPIRPRPAPALKIENLGWENRLEGISLEVGAGEIVGLGGLDGQGQKSLLLALFGVLRGVTGRVTVNGRAVRPRSPAQAKTRAIGIALVPEDRKTEGLMLPMSIADNLAIASLPTPLFGTFRRRAARSSARSMRRSRACRSRSAPRATRCRRFPAATSRRSSSPSG